MASSFPITFSAAGPSTPRTVVGVWTKKSDQTPVESNATEIEARLETPPPNFSLPMRPPTSYSAYREGPPTPDTLDQFFAAGAFEGCRSYRDASSSPPPYSPGGYIMATEQRPQLSNEELPTLARMLFRYGFLFFPFWLAGIYILCSPLLPTPDWEAGKTESEKAQLLRLLREIELKWARRCLLAIFGLLVFTFFLVLVIKFGIMRTL
ncbi:hypothetical protein K439DRAFT_1401325 [Ramaria rubella]|nr:hypothetical protein K439DRAFT_1401325 [Ramaria rubella]